MWQEERDGCGAGVGGSAWPQGTGVGAAGGGGACGVGGRPAAPSAPLWFAPCPLGLCCPVVFRARLRAFWQRCASRVLPNSAVQVAARKPRIFLPRQKELNEEKYLFQLVFLPQISVERLLGTAPDSEVH